MEHFEPSVQRYIVMRLACYASCSKVAKEVQAQFQVDASIERIMYYNPLSGQGRGLDPELKALFHDTRAEYRASADGIPLATQIGRLTLLQEIYDDNARNPVIQAGLLKQAAQETGGLFVRQGGNSTPEPVEDELSRLSDDELVQRIAEAENRVRGAESASD